MMILRRITILMACLLLAGSGYLAAQEPGQNYELRKFDFAFTELKGKKYRLSDFEGKIILLNFWATWCGPCRQETPGLVRLYQKLAKGQQRGSIAFIAVAIWSEDLEIKQFVEDNRIPYLVTNDKDEEIAGLYRLSSLPVSYLIGRDGKLVRRFSGHAEEAELERILRQLLETGK
jgi:thiol-disulfide isomerase/thioredoxin